MYKTASHTCAHVFNSERYEEPLSSYCYQLFILRMATAAEKSSCKTLKFIKVKRKASEEVNSPLVTGNNAKRFKFLGSAASVNDDTIKELISNNSEMAVDEDASFEISDLADFINKYRQRVKQFPKPKESVTLNGTKLISLPSNLDPFNRDESDGEDSGDYVYDVYCDGGSEHGNEQVLLHDVDMNYREVYDEENDSNDEDHEANQYPDDEDAESPVSPSDSEEDEWLDQDTRDMLNDFEKYTLRLDSSDESDYEDCYGGDD